MTYLHVNDPTVEIDGIFGALISFKGVGGGWGQGYGWYGLGDHASAYIKAMLDVFQAWAWEEIKGKEIYILRRENGGMIEGFVSKDHKKTFISRKFWDGLKGD